MKITTKQLRQIIEEELESIIEGHITREESIADWAVVLSGNEVSAGSGAKELIDFLTPMAPAALEAHQVRIEAVGWGIDYPEMSGTEALNLAQRDWAVHPQNTGRPRPKRNMGTYFDASDMGGPWEE